MGADPLDAPAGGRDGGVERAPSPPQPLVLRREAKAEEWHFDEAVHEKQLEALRAECEAHKARERTARAREKAIRERGERQAEEALRSRTFGDIDVGGEVSKMRSALHELEARSEQLLEQTRREVGEIEFYMAKEAKRRAELEFGVRSVRSEADVVRRREAEIDEQQAQAFANIDDRLAVARSEARREIEELQREAEARVRAIEEKSRADLAAVDAEFAQVAEKTRTAIATEVSCRRDGMQAADERLARESDLRVRAKLGATHTGLLERRMDTVCKVRETQAREFAHETQRLETAAAALAALGCATAEAHEASTRELSDKRCAVATAEALGGTFPRSTQYSLHFDGRARSALQASAQAALQHGSAPASARAAGRFGATA